LPRAEARTVPKIQRKLMAALAALVAVTLLATTWVAERGLRAREMERIEQSLHERAQLARELLADHSLAPGSDDTLYALAVRAAAASDARVTLIAPDGTVTADSAVAPEDLVRLENHGHRPEVQRARAGETGVATRRSVTLQRELLYVAVPLEPGADAGVVRLAVDLDEVEAAAAELRRRLLAADGIGLIAALLVAYVLARRIVQPLSDMRDAVRAIGSGQLNRRLRPRSDDELGEIALAINGMAQQLGLRLEDVTAEKEQLQAVLASMVEGVLVLDVGGSVVLANRRLREQISLWGPVEGRKVLEVIRHPGIDDALSAAANTADPIVREVEVGERDPRTLLIHAAAFPRDGPRMGTVAVFHDVTELRHLENVRRDFVANASHELKTPLTAIRGFAETLLSASRSDDGTRSQLEVILRNASRLESLILDMIELSRIESRRLPLQPADVALARVARVLLKDLEPRLTERNLTATLNDSAADPDVALAHVDRRALEQVLSNLLDNAVKYTDPGGSIHVEISSSADAIHVSVTDTGVGIPQDEQARVFERFYRVDKARSRALGGTGLGLAIVKHLVQAMGGEILLTSEPGRGSTFRFRVPRADRARR